MKNASVNPNPPAAPRRLSHLHVVPDSGTAAATQDAVRLRPSGTPVPDGWRSVTVAAAPDEHGIHQPSWEVHFDTEVIARLVRGEPVSDEVAQAMVDNDWEEVLLDRPDGSPQNVSFWAQRTDAPSLVAERERSRLLHPSNAVDMEVGF